MRDELTLRPIGAIRREDERVWLEVDEPYRPGLLAVNRFSHVNVLWWVGGHDNESSRSIMQTELPYAPGVTAGVFACRAEYRPNPIATTTCKVLRVDVDAGEVDIAAIDAYAGSPLLDIKPYIGVVDRVRDIRVPEWYDGWPEWMPDEGIGLDGD